MNANPQIDPLTIRRARREASAGVVNHPQQTVKRIRVGFLTNKTTRVNLPVFERLVDSESLELVHTLFYDTVGQTRRSPRTTLTRIGVRGVISKFMEQLGSRVRLAIGKRCGRQRVKPRSPYEVAAIRSLSHSMVADMNDRATINRLHNLDLDILLVCVCSQILNREVLSLPRTKFVNIHPSLLPSYRGPTPTFWMLYNGESETGVTMHLMTTKIDEGRILAQLAAPLDRDKSESQIERELFQLVAPVVEESLQSLQASAPILWPEAGRRPSSYYTFPTSTQRRELQRKISGRERGNPVSHSCSGTTNPVESP